MGWVDNVGVFTDVIGCVEGGVVRGMIWAEVVGCTGGIVLVMPLTMTMRWMRRMGWWVVYRRYPDPMLPMRPWQISHCLDGVFPAASTRFLATISPFSDANRAFYTFDPSLL